MGNLSNISVAGRLTSLPYPARQRCYTIADTVFPHLHIPDFIDAEATNSK